MSFMYQVYDGTDDTISLNNKINVINEYGSEGIVLDDNDRLIRSLQEILSNDSFCFNNFHIFSALYNNMADLQKTIQVQDYKINELNKHILKLNSVLGIDSIDNMSEEVK